MAVFRCAHPNRSPLYKLCVAMVFINYAQLCLPCVVVIFMLPVLCFCLPCLIRILARIQDPMRGKGASVNAINRLPLMRYRQVAQPHTRFRAGSSRSRPLTGPLFSPAWLGCACMAGWQMAPQGASTNSSSSSSAVAGSGRPSVSSVGESNSSCCAICISEYSGDDECRLLPCTHYFHKQVGRGPRSHRRLSARTLNWLCLVLRVPGCLVGSAVRRRMAQGEQQQRPSRSQPASHACMHLYGRTDSRALRR